MQMIQRNVTTFLCNLLRRLGVSLVGLKPEFKLFLMSVFSLIFFVFSLILTKRYPRTRLLSCLCLVVIYNTYPSHFINMGTKSGLITTLLELLSLVNEHAKKRGANIYAEFLSGSFTCDAYHMTEPYPDGAGVILCIERTLASAGVSREQINYINAHATSTHAGDLREYQSLVHCFGQNPELKVNSTKSMIGHLLGAAGVVEARSDHVMLPLVKLLHDSTSSVQYW